MLRDYQENAIANLRNIVKTGKKRVILVLPTGGGKTIIASQIAANAVAGGRRVGFFAHRVELLRQTAETFKRVGIERVGFIAAGLPEDSDAPAQVCSIDTFRNRERPPFDIIFVDEAHRSMAKSYRECVFDAYPDALIFGLTATPERLDGKGLGEVFQEIQIVATPIEMIQGGYITKPKIYRPKRVLDLKGVRSIAGDYDMGDLEREMMAPDLIGDIVEHWQKFAKGVKTFAFAVGVDHSKKIADAFKAASISAIHVDAKTPKDERVAALAEFERGSIDVLCSCGLFIEGVDVPSARCAILARPTKSVTVYLQSVGRVLRPYRDTPSILLDHAGLTHADVMDLPWVDREWSLEGKSKRTKASIKQSQCPHCFAILEGAPVMCPECGEQILNVMGATHELRHEEGELVEVDAPLLPKAEDKTFDNSDNDSDDPLGIFAGLPRGWWGTMPAHEVSWVKKSATKKYYSGHKAGSLYYEFKEKFKTDLKYKISQHVGAFFATSEYWQKTYAQADRRRAAFGWTKPDVASTIRSTAVLFSDIEGDKMPGLCPHGLKSCGACI